MKRPYKNKKWLYQKYVIERINSSEIAKSYNIGSSAICNWIKKFNIKRNELYKNKDWLYRKYITEELTTAEMAILAKCSDVSISNWLKRHNIKARKRNEVTQKTRLKLSELQKNHPLNCNCFVCKRKKGEKIKHKENCQCLCCRIKRRELVGKNNPMYGIQRFGKNNPAYGRIFTKDEKERRSNAAKGNKNPMYGMSKEKAPNWRGGLSFLPYTPEFDKELREQIRIRDGYKCQKCGKTQEDNLIESKKSLAVHHIDYDKTNNHPSNLISLCLACHCATGFNRKHWMSYFMEVQNPNIRL